jgi:hypothetical protein
MSKVHDMGKARNDGLLMALRIAREAEEAGESPAEEIERELLFRKASNVAGPFTQAELSHDTLAIKRHTIKTIKAVAMISCWETFGFGEKRLSQLDECMERYAAALCREEIDWTDILEMLEAKLKRKVDWVDGQ